MQWKWKMCDCTMKTSCLAGIWERERNKVRVKYTQVHYMCTLDLTIMTILRSVNRHGEWEDEKVQVYDEMPSVPWVHFDECFSSYFAFYSPLVY